jgi:phage virion morphogenesis protein
MAGAEDFARAKRRIEDMAKRAKDLTPVLRVVGEDVRTFVDDRFETKTDPTGAAWAPMAESTRRQRGDDASLMVDTARLRQSTAVVVARTQMRVGTNVEYGTYHHVGTGRLPSRRSLPFSQSGRELEMAGPAGELWRGAIESVREYIITGEIT